MKIAQFLFFLNKKIAQFLIVFMFKSYQQKCMCVATVKPSVRVVANFFSKMSFLRHRFYCIFAFSLYLIPFRLQHDVFLLFSSPYICFGSTVSDMCWIKSKCLVKPVRVLKNIGKKIRHVHVIKDTAAPKTELFFRVPSHVGAQEYPKQDLLYYIVRGQRPINIPQ